MTRLPVVPYRRLKRVAEAAGFVWLRCDGSHNVFRNEQGQTVVIPDHGSSVIVRPLLRKILRDLDLTPEEYQDLLNR